ncbi:MAG: NAD-dependent deacylase [Paracoccaceae bacterium]|nr:MAG: NAD-dependent deacylase [Paracoccaceae bacterium]
MKRIVVLTGAGVSAESGLGTFRDRDGLWSQYDLNEVATPEGFARNPQKVLDFYNARRANAAGARPNAAHLALARLGAALRERLVLVTQNVDVLHEQAGSTGVIHMHGRLDRARCTGCGADWQAPAVMQATDPCPACGAPATRPDIVWFGEEPKMMDEIEQAVRGCGVFVSIGTSGVVWPAAGLVARANFYARAHTVEINMEPTGADGAFADRRLGPASVTVPAWVDEVLARGP